MNSFESKSTVKNQFNSAWYLKNLHFEWRISSEYILCQTVKCFMFRFTHFFFICPSFILTSLKSRIDRKWKASSIFYLDSTCKNATSMYQMKLKNWTWFICLHIFIYCCPFYNFLENRRRNHLVSIWKLPWHCYRHKSHPFAMLSHFIRANSYIWWILGDS